LGLGPVYTTVAAQQGFTEMQIEVHLYLQPKLQQSDWEKQLS